MDLFELYPMTPTSTGWLARSVAVHRERRKCGGLSFCHSVLGNLLSRCMAPTTTYKSCVHACRILLARTRIRAAAAAGAAAGGGGAGAAAALLSFSITNTQCHKCNGPMTAQQLAESSVFSAAAAADTGGNNGNMATNSWNSNNTGANGSSSVAVNQAQAAVDQAMAAQQAAAAAAVAPQ